MISYPILEPEYVARFLTGFLYRIRCTESNECRVCGKKGERMNHKDTSDRSQGEKVEELGKEHRVLE